MSTYTYFSPTRISSVNFSLNDYDGWDCSSCVFRLVDPEVLPVCYRTVRLELLFLWKYLEKNWRQKQFRNQLLALMPVLKVSFVDIKVSNSINNRKLLCESFTCCKWTSPVGNLINRHSPGIVPIFSWQDFISSKVTSCFDIKRSCSYILECLHNSRGSCLVYVCFNNP